MMRVHDDKEFPVELVGSWTTVIGPNTDEVSELVCVQATPCSRTRLHLPLGGAGTVHCGGVPN